MIKSLLKLTFLVLTICLSLNSGFAREIQTQENYYVLEFDHLDQQEVKPIIALLYPLFNQIPHLENGDFDLFYYSSSGNVELEEIQEILGSKSNKLLRLESLSEKAYNKITH